MSNHTIVCAGIDTGKRKLDAAIGHGAGALQVDNTAEGHTVLSAWLRRHQVERVGIEATGGCEHIVVTRLRGDGFTVIVFQPGQVRAYARFHLKKAKTDRIDAALIADCAAARKAEDIHAPPDPRIAPFAEHLTMIEQIGEDIACIKTRRATVRDHDIRKGNAYDNAVVESFFSNLKNELVHHRRFLTREQAKAEIFDYIEIFYNRQRAHATLRYLSPLNYENSTQMAQINRPENPG